MNRRVAVALGMIAIGLLVAMTGWRVVRPGEQIVVRRLGRIVARAGGRVCTGELRWGSIASIGCGPTRYGG